MTDNPEIPCNRCVHGTECYGNTDCTKYSDYLDMSDQSKMTQAVKEFFRLDDTEYLVMVCIAYTRENPDNEHYAEIHVAGTSNPDVGDPVLQKVANRLYKTSATTIAQYAIKLAVTSEDDPDESTNQNGEKIA